jgi:hypothetical protein
MLSENKAFKKHKIFAQEIAMHEGCHRWNAAANRDGKKLINKQKNT